MTSPYRDAEVVEVDESREAGPLAAFAVDGAAGVNGRHGANGSNGVRSGQDGGRGGDGGPAGPGEPAGSIRLELSGGEDDGVVALKGEQVAANRTRTPIRTTVVIDEAGVIALSAVGGPGGHGGDGGNGGDGARGHDGSDATRYSSGGNGGDGGDGGNGGYATSGAPGGSGGSIVVAVADADTPLLMLVRHDIRGGAGGKPGRNGSGGSGGAGGSGGSSYSWTESESYTDMNGSSQTRTTYHSNSGGFSGSRGRSGSSGSAAVVKGKDGAFGAFAIEVTTASGVVRYPSRYDLRLVAFSHDSENADCVYEPGERVRVFDVEVENAGGMPTPTQDDLQLALVAGGWVAPEPGELACQRGLEPGARWKAPGELTFRIKDFVPGEPGDPLEIEQSILHRALLPSVRRAFEHYQEGEAIDAGRFVIRFPARLSTVANLVSLAPGEATRIRFSITNQSRFALGAASECKRVLRIKVATAADSELDDSAIDFAVDGTRLAPSSGWTHELSRLDPGDTAAVELALHVKDGAPEYRRFAGTVTLELGQLAEPAAPRPVQLRAFDVRVARRFAVSDADLLLVVNHKTTREEIAAWEAVASDLACKIAIWDLSRERHLDLEAKLADGISLSEWFAHKAIAILDNAIDGPDGPTHPHRFLADDQALRAAEAGIDIVFVGKGPPLERVLVPTAPAAELPAEPVVLASSVAEARHAITPVFKRYWLRFWKQPPAAWLEREAILTSAQIHDAHPERRHVVIHRYAPEVASKFLVFKRWKVGTLETVRTLDAAAGAIVHAKVDDEALHDPAYALGDTATTALLVMFDFAENLVRLKKKLAEPDGNVARIVDALVLDIANELTAVATGRVDDLERALPRLGALAGSKLAAELATPAGQAIVQLAGRLVFFAESQCAWWRPFGRSTRLRARVRAAVDQLLAGAFAESELPTARNDAERVAADLGREHKQLRKTQLAPRRAQWALDRAREPLAVKGVTADTELYTTSDERVLSGDAYDAMLAAKSADAAARAALVAAAEQARKDLEIT